MTETQDNLSPKSTPAAPAARAGRRNGIVAAIVVGVFAGMIGLTFASAELYTLFCNATGYNGTTQVARQAPKQTLDRIVKVRFDSNVAPGLPWRFEPEVTEVSLKLGETAEVNYRIRNLSDMETTGIATYNVQPDIAGAFFSKIQCFCFTEQTLKPHEVRDQTVVFFVDPALAKDADAASVKTITLSYTFNPAKPGTKPVASVGSTTKLQ